MGTQSSPKAVSSRQDPGIPRLMMWAVLGQGVAANTAGGCHSPPNFTVNPSKAIPKKNSLEPVSLYSLPPPPVLLPSSHKEKAGLRL